MNTTISVTGIKPPDEEWKKMKNVYDACETAGIDPPWEVSNYFNNQKPHSLGVTVNLNGSPAVNKFEGDMQEGYEIDISKLPGDIKIIRVIVDYN